jgi:hypothetical protein
MGNIIMKVKNIILVILILLVTGIISIMGIKLYNASESEIVCAEVENFMKKEKDMNAIISRFGEPDLRITKETSPMVEYAGCRLTNTGNVLIWDKKKLIGGSYVLVISFHEGTNKVDCRALSN